MRLQICPDGTLGARMASAAMTFNYEAFNAQQAALADQQEHYHEVREANARKQRIGKQKKVAKLNKEYAQLMDAWTTEKTFETFCRLEDIEEILVKILG